MIISCVQRAASAAPARELVEADLAGHARGRGCRPGRSPRGGAPARRRRSARRRSRRGRRGTRSRRRPRPRRRRAPPRRRGGCRGCRRGSRPASRTVRSWTGRRLRWPVAVVAAVVVAEVAVLLLRPRDGVIEPAPVRAESYFSARRDRAGARLPPAAARALRRRAGRRARCCWRCSWRARRAACAGRSAGPCWPPRPPARRCRWRSPRSRAAA